MSPERFKNVRMYKDMSRPEFAEFLGLSESTIYAIEAGHRGMTLEVKSKLARKFEISEEFMQFEQKLKEWS